MRVAQMLKHNETDVNNKQETVITNVNVQADIIPPNLGKNIAHTTFYCQGFKENKNKSKLWTGQDHK